jgi:hypothetical protein
MNEMIPQLLRRSDDSKSGRKLDHLPVVALTPVLELNSSVIGIELLTVKMSTFYFLSPFN